MGTPTQPGPVSGETAPSIGGIYQYICSNASVGAVYYDWVLPYNGNPVWSQYGGTISGPIDTLTPNFIVGSSSGWVQIIGYNSCGPSGASGLRVFPISGSGGGIRSVIIAPNPSTTEVKIYWKDKEPKKSYQVFLFDKTSTKVHESTHDEDEATISVRSLTSGTYYLILNQGNLHHSQSILVNH